MTPSASSNAWLLSDGQSATPPGPRNSNPPGHNAGDRPQGANPIALVVPMTRPCERAQAQLFADILRQEVAQIRKSITKAESQWRRRCEEGDVDPPERLRLVRERMQEAVKMLDALNARFPANR
jgi:hypothetical protein